MYNNGNTNSCVNCKFCQIIIDYNSYWCKNPNVSTTYLDPVEGYKRNHVTCRDARSRESMCGANGKYFVKKKSLFTMFLNFIKGDSNYD